MLVRRWWWRTGGGTGWDDVTRDGRKEEAGWWDGLWRRVRGRSRSNMEGGGGSLPGGHLDLPHH